MGELRLHKEV